MTTLEAVFPKVVGVALAVGGAGLLAYGAVEADSFFLFMGPLMGVISVPFLLVKAPAGEAETEVNPTSRHNRKTVYNPATGLRMINNSRFGADVGGNIYGTSNKK